MDKQKNIRKCMENICLNKTQVSLFEKPTLLKM